MAHALKGRVSHGRLVVDEPVTFPEGTEVELTFADSGDDLDEVEREALHRSIGKGLEEGHAGDSRPAGEILSKRR